MVESGLTYLHSKDLITYVLGESGFKKMIKYISHIVFYIN